SEFAFVDVLKHRIPQCQLTTDLQHYEKHGDSGRDFDIRGVRYQVKCRTYRGNSTLVRKMTKGKTLLKEQSDRYVFSRWEFSGDCWLLGWCDKNTVLESPFKKSPVGDHWNLVVDDTRLLPMNRLIEEIRQTEISECR